MLTHICATPGIRVAKCEALGVMRPTDAETFVLSFPLAAEPAHNAAGQQIVLKLDAVGCFQCVQSDLAMRVIAHMVLFQRGIVEQIEIHGQLANTAAWLAVWPHAVELCFAVVRPEPRPRPSHFHLRTRYQDKLGLQPVVSQP